MTTPLPTSDDSQLAAGVTLSFSYVYEDLFLTGKSPPRRWPGWRWWTVLLGSFGILWLVIQYVQQNFAARGGSVDFSAVKFLLLSALVMTIVVETRNRHFRHRKEWESRNLEKTYNVTLATAGVTWEFTTATYIEKWITYAHYREDETGFWLYRESDPASPILLPARAVSPAQKPLLRELLRRYARQSEGFPVELAAISPNSTPPSPADTIKS